MIISVKCKVVKYVYSFPIYDRLTDKQIHRGAPLLKTEPEKKFKTLLRICCSTVLVVKELAALLQNE